MTKYFRLTPLIKSPQTVKLYRSCNGITQYFQRTFYQGEDYELGDDPVFIKSVEELTITKDSCKELLELLDEAKTPYTVHKKKKCCGGGNKEVVTYNVFEVFDDET